MLSAAANQPNWESFFACDQKSQNFLRTAAARSSKGRTSSAASTSSNCSGGLYTISRSRDAGPDGPWAVAGTTSNPAIRAGRLPGAGFANSWRSTGPALEQLPERKVPSTHGEGRFPVNPSTCRSSRLLFLGVPLRTEQYRVQPPLRRQPHP
jgi:hypothetical protein